ncbi:MAG: GDP-mannose 4,6-dehydratase [Acidobacteriota bacterium]
MPTTGPTLVTGATGFVGGHVLDRLADWAPLVAWCRPDGAAPDPERHLDWRPVDLTDGPAVADAIEDAQPARIFHLAGAPNVGTSWHNAVPHFRVNALGTHHLLEAVRRRRRPCRVLIVSSAQVYQTSDEPLDEESPVLPPNPYGLSKLAQEEFALRAAREDDLDVVFARPFNHIGPRQSPAFAVASFARQIARIEAGLAPPELRVGNLETRRDITDVRDVAAAYELIMASAPAARPYNVCSGSAWRMRDLLDELVHLSHVNVRIDVDQSRLRPNDVLVVQGDATRIRTELGWAPKIPIEQTLRDTLDWWRARTAAGTP